MYRRVVYSTMVVLVVVPIMQNHQYFHIRCIFVHIEFGVHDDRTTVEHTVTVRETFKHFLISSTIFSHF